MTQPSNRKLRGASTCCIGRRRHRLCNAGVSPTPSPAASSVPQQEKPNEATVEPPESLPVSLCPPPLAAVTPPESSLAHPLSLEVPVQHHQQPRLSPAVTRSMSRQRGGLGPQYGVVSMLVARENIAMIVVDQYPPRIPASELPSCPASEFVTPDSNRQSCDDEQAALHIVMYIKSTSTCGITFQRGPGNGLHLELYVDADYAHEANDWRFFSRGAIMCAGACVFLYSTMQKSITLSSTKAEYLVMATGLARRFSCGTSGVLFFGTSMFGVTR